MWLDEAACWDRLHRSRHGVLSTLHRVRGVDAVPVVFVVHDGRLVVPVDTVKPKSGARLQRLRNIADDPRVAVLVDHYDDDWSELWWVRAHGHAHEAAPTNEQVDALTAAFPHYRGEGAVAAAIVVDVDRVDGWQARPAPGPDPCPPLSRAVPTLEGVPEHADVPKAILRTLSPDASA